MHQEGQGLTAPASLGQAERALGLVVEPVEGAGRGLVHVPAPVQVPDPENQYRVRGEERENLI